MAGKRVLILGGTGEATALATRAAEIPGLDVISSLAGRTRQPMVPAASTRSGGFGGVAGLIAYLQQQQIDGLIDATHPFAAQMSYHAATAARAVGIPHLMLMRPPWEPQVGDASGQLRDRWIEVDSHAAAAAKFPDLAQRIFLTIGRQELAAFAHLQSCWFLMRMVEPPQPHRAVPPGQILLERGPFLLADERSLLQRYGIGAIVSKNSGGDATHAKIIAARELGIPVVMIQRPAMPPGDRVADLESALEWLKNHCNEASHPPKPWPVPSTLSG